MQPPKQHEEQNLTFPLDQVFKSYPFVLEMGLQNHESKTSRNRTSSGAVVCVDKKVLYIGGKLITETQACSYDNVISVIPSQAKKSTHPPYSNANMTALSSYVRLGRQDRFFTHELNQDSRNETRCSVRDLRLVRAHITELISSGISLVYF